MALYEPLRTPQPRSGSRPDYFHPHCSQKSSYQPLSRPIAPQPSRSFAPSPRRCLLLSRPLPQPSYVSSSLPSSPTGYPTLTDRRAARASTPTPLSSGPDPRLRPGSARGVRRPNTATRSRPGSLPRANSVPGKHLRRSTPSSSRHRPLLESRLQTSSAGSPLTAPSGVVAEGQMTVESDREGSGREALSRALRAVSRNGSSARSRSWSRSETDEAEPNKSHTPSSPCSSIFPSPCSAAESEPNGFPFDYLACHNHIPGSSNSHLGGGYITFASLNVHAPPSPPQSPTPSESHLSHDPLRKGWWTR